MCRSKTADSAWPWYQLLEQRNCLQIQIQLLTNRLHRRNHSQELKCGCRCTNHACAAGRNWTSSIPLNCRAQVVACGVWCAGERPVLPWSSNKCGKQGWVSRTLPSVSDAFVKAAEDHARLRETEAPPEPRRAARQAHFVSAGVRYPSSETGEHGLKKTCTPVAWHSAFA